MPRSRPHPKLTSDPFFGLFFHPETAVHSTRWRGPLVNFFPPSLRVPVLCNPSVDPKHLFLQWFRLHNPLRVQPRKKNPRPNFRHCSINPSLFNRLNIGKQVNVWLRVVFFCPPLFPAMIPNIPPTPIFVAFSGPQTPKTKRAHTRIGQIILKLDFFIALCSGRG